MTSIVLDGNTIYSSAADNVVRHWEKVPKYILYIYIHTYI